MGILDEVREKLKAGALPADLVKAGYARSSVYQEYSKIRSSMPAGDEELAGLRRRKEVLKIKAEIDEIEKVREKLPDRVAALEMEIVALREFVCKAVDTALAASFMYTDGLNEPRPEVIRHCAGWTEKTIK